MSTYRTAAVPAPPERPRGLADELAEELAAACPGLLLWTPCGVLAPLARPLEESARLLTVAREDTAVGMAVGSALGGARPCVLMQNSGLGQCVNALASLVVPYDVEITLVVSLRGTGPDDTMENLAMGGLTGALLDLLGIPALTLGPETPADAVRTHLRRPGTAALLIPPDSFGWAA